MKLVFALFLTILALFSAGVNAGTCTLPASYVDYFATPPVSLPLSEW